jgi:hypothetical protein
MKPISAFKFFLLSHFGKPACNREIYKAIKKFKVHSIVEVGMGDGTRAETLIQIAQKFSLTETIRYTGIDMFEGREDGQPKLMLKEMHKRLNVLGIKAQLVPGSPEMGISRIANSHLRTDLIVISSNGCGEALEACWMYLPRMLHAQSLVMIQPANEANFETLSRLEVEKRVAQQKPRLKTSAA